MELEMIRAFFAWCSAINLALLLWWALFLLFAHDLTFPPNLLVAAEDLFLLVSAVTTNKFFIQHLIEAENALSK